MSMKRQAANQLTHDNWDQEDAADHEDMGTYQIADKDVLEKRVIRTAKRRFQVSGDEPKKNVFSGFGGFNKAQPSSFDFLANLSKSNEAKTNGSSVTKTEDTVTSSVFTNSALGKVATDIFGAPSTVTKACPTVSNAPANKIFGISSTSTSSSASPFAASKVDPTVGSGLFNKPPTSPPNDAASVGVKANVFPKTTYQDNSRISFGADSPLKSQTSDSNSNGQIKDITVSSNETAKEDKVENKSKSNSKTQAYYTKLKGLNDSVSAWISKHVEETPLCILTPIFKDYEKHLKAVQDEFEKDDEETDKNENTNITVPEAPVKQSSSVFTVNTKPSPTMEVKNKSEDKPAKTFSFGITPATTASTLTTPSSGFSFGINKNVEPAVSGAESTTTTTSSPFSFAPNSVPSPKAPFSFGIGPSKFSFSPTNQQKPEECNEKTQGQDEDEPPKVEFSPVVEENSIYEKRCKVFVKKDGEFADKGVGTLYIKKIEDSEKYQLIVRANTNLGTLLVNIILGLGVPTQRMGKNNVMLVCIPTADAKPPPTPVLIRVKTAEEADELLQTLDKYKA